MLYCRKCGSELKGAKNFCMVCGAKQDQIKKEDTGTVMKAPDSKKKKVEDNGECIRCGEDTEKKCFFCEGFVCRDHYNRMQANIYPYEELLGLKANGETKKINEGWRGFIINACPRCSSIKTNKGLTNGELDEINIIDMCSWYKLDR
jgi:hypothetical protein